LIGLSNRLRVGEKIGLGFGAVALILLVVIWHDQRGFQEVLADYRALEAVDGARQLRAFMIESRLTAMRAAGERFLGTRDPGLAEAARREGTRLLEALRELARVDEDARLIADELLPLAEDLLARFVQIEAAWRIKGLDENSGLQGAFRRGAHVLEERIVREMPGLQSQVLQLRRREKDYLLRGGDDYRVMVEGIAAVLSRALQEQPIDTADKAVLEALVADYVRDFQALVEQDRRIQALTADMDRAAARITPLVQAHLERANRTMTEMSERIARASETRARRALMMGLGATMIGILLAVLLTRRIVRPVRHMAGLLERLTHENPTDRIPTTAHPRDEIANMAISLNTLADHKSTFHHWWRNAMREAIALRDLHATADDPRFEAAVAELRSAIDSRLGEARALKARLERECEQVLAVAERLGDARDKARIEDGGALRQAVERMRELIQVLDP
jgi:methyl-accepting chemotaxis protein